jgi:hypothetical protein
LQACTECAGLHSLVHVDFLFFSIWWLQSCVLVAAHDDCK